MRTLHPIVVVLIAIVCASQAAEPKGEETWQADPAVVARASKRAGFNFEESNVPDYTLPDPLVASDGTPVARETWPARRTEIFELFQREMYGRPPADAPENTKFTVLDEDAHALNDRATRTLIEIGFDTPHAGRFACRTQVYTPNAAKKPVPAIVLLQFQGLTDPATPLVIDRGWALAIVDRTLIAEDDKDMYRGRFINAFHGDGPLAPDGGRAIAAWAWAAGRVLEYLRTDPAIDAARIGVAGHSRMGKTALWAAASDPRFAIALSNESGCGGAALSRRKFGETVRQINTAFPHWFCENFQKYNDRESELPIDQHMLVALIAPRPVYVASADEDLWSDPRGEFLSCVHASPVYELLGVEGLETGTMPPLEKPLTNGRIGYHIRRGRHALADYDWQRFLDFAARQLPATTH